MAAIGCNGQEILRAHLAAIGCNGLTSQQFLSLPLKAQVEINVKFSDWKSQPLVYFNAYNLAVSRVFLKSAAWLELFFSFSFIPVLSLNFSRLVLTYTAKLPCDKMYSSLR